MYLLDTNVVSELRKARTHNADQNVVAWANSVSIASLFLSVTVITRNVSDFSSTGVEMMNPWDYVGNDMEL